MDKVPTRLYSKTPYWRAAKSMVYDTYGDLFERFSSVTSNDEVILRLNLAASGGVPWTRYGLISKRDCLNDAQFRKYLHELYANPSISKPVWRVSGKIEWYPAEKLDANKVRTFIVPPFHLLWYQVKLYLGQNNSMKMFHWSAYGFNPYMGGTHNLAQRLLINKIFLFYDAVGWDRVLPVLKTVYKLRNNFGPPCEGIREWVTQNTVESFLLMAGGEIVKKEVGNNSGSGNTTNDNILAHDLIADYSLLHLFGGDSDKVESCEAALFGDDNAMSIPDPGMSYDDVEKVFREAFSHFGMELDPFHIQDTLEGVEFLGFKFHLHEGFWIPQYNQARLISSFCYDYESKLTDAKSISKSWTLTVMAAGGDRDIFEFMSRTVQHYCDLLVDSTCPTVQAFVMLGAPQYLESVRFLSGVECGPIITLFDFEYASTLR
jgi:hypothetical protein